MSARAYVCLGAILAAGCNGTDTGNPPLAFDSSSCKRPPAAPSMAKGITPHASVRDPVHDGFVCTLWERIDDETVRIEFTNYRAGCSADRGWRPSIEQHEGGLDIHLDSDCMFAACGYCVYDLSFTARVPADASDLDVRLFGNTCTGPASIERSATLSLAEKSSGVLCTEYRPRAFGEVFSCGNPPAARWGYCPVQPVTPTTATCPDGTALPPPCQDGLKCTSIGTAGAMCLPTCTSDADCAEAGPTHCQEGVCRL